MEALTLAAETYDEQNDRSEAMRFFKLHDRFLRPYAVRVLSYPQEGGSERRATPTPAAQIVELVPDEDTGMSVMHGLRRRFDWSGTEFIRADVDDHVREALADREGEHPEPTDAEVDALVDAVMASYTYRKLADRFAERGNELLADEARSVVEASSDSRPGEETGR